MADIDLSALTVDELKKLQKDVSKAVETHQNRQRKDALAAAEAKAKEYGYSLSDLTGNPKKARTKGNLPPKYRHPENPSLTWSGRGRKPGWIKEAENAGQSTDEFLITN